MSGTRNKNLLFFSLHPNDHISRECLKELSKLPELSNQVVKICIHDPKDFRKPPTVRLPKIVNQCKERGLIPLIAVAGFNEPVFAQQALSWIKQSALKKSGVMPSNIHGSGASDNCSTIDQASMSGNTLFDTDYNIGFGSGKGEFSKNYASIDESCENRIVTYDEFNDKGKAAEEIKQRLDQLKFNRDADTPNIRRIGGIDAGGGGGGNMPMMPPMPPMPGGGMQMQQGGMPMMPQMSGRGGGMPMMPQMQMPQPRQPQQPQHGMPMMPQMPMQQGGRRSGNSKRHHNKKR